MHLFLLSTEEGKTGHRDPKQGFRCLVISRHWPGKKKKSLTKLNLSSQIVRLKLNNNTGSEIDFLAHLPRGLVDEKNPPAKHIFFTGQNNKQPFCVI